MFFFKELALILDKYLGSEKTSIQFVFTQA